MLDKMFTIGNKMNNIPYLLALHSIDGFGPMRLKAILNYFKDPKLAWEANVGEVRKIGVPQTVIDLLAETRKTLNPETYAKSIKDSGIKWMSIFDEDYPKLLKQIYDPPAVLYYKGKIDPDLKAIAVVGSRKMTGYGKVVTEQFTKDLVAAHITIVSGLARGIDTEAHKTAVAEKGQTIAVLGSGLNQIYPPENEKLVREIASGFGAVMTEFPPDCLVRSENFPIRNRIISGLCLGILVIEATENSGSLITARFALEQGREVFAVPGLADSNLFKGSNDLIRQGARPVFSAEEILEELSLNKVQSVADLSKDEQKILEVLENKNMHIEEIGKSLNFPLQVISALLLKMEISGLVQSIGAGIYCRK